MKRVYLLYFDFSETRYLLLLSESNSLLPMLQEHISAIGDFQTIIGSGFPKDQEYSQVGGSIANMIM